MKIKITITALPQSPLPPLQLQFPPPLLFELQWQVPQSQEEEDVFVGKYPYE
jgi:hypothetical protein